MCDHCGRVNQINSQLKSSLMGFAMDEPIAESDIFAASAATAAVSSFKYQVLEELKYLIKSETISCHSSI